MDDEEKGEASNLLDLDKVLREKAPKLYAKLPSFVIKYAKGKIHIDELNEILTIYADRYGVDFMESVVDYFGLTLNVRGLDNLPTDGRYVFVSNHPLGGLDGICLSAVVGKKFDKKIKYLVNDVLYFIKNLRPIFVPVNKYGSQSRQNALRLNEAYESDDQIVTFPAGLCSRKIKGQIVDLAWHKSFVQKAIETKRDIIPVYFEAENSNFFYRFANFRKSLGIKFNIELFFLPDEMFKNKGSIFNITFGRPIKHEMLDASKTTNEWVDYVRAEVYGMKDKK